MTEEAVGYKYLWVERKGMYDGQMRQEAVKDKGMLQKNVPEEVRE